MKLSNGWITKIIIFPKSYDKALKIDSKDTEI